MPHATIVAIASDWVHLAATAVWIGGLAFLAAISSIHGITAPDHSAFLSGLVARFSLLAKISVASLAVTGIYAAWLHLPSWNSFLSTPYGRALTIKLVLIVPALLIGLVNWRRVVPALAEFSRQPLVEQIWKRRLPGLLRIESALGAAILLAVAFLTGLPPATALSAGGPVSLSQINQDAGVRVNLVLDSTQTGSRHAVVTLADAGGNHIGDARQVTLYLTMMDMDMGLETIQASPFPDGSYRADLPLTMAGKWKVSIEVTPMRGDAFVTEFELSSGF